MKKFSFLALAAVGLLFGACSDSDVTDQGTNPLADKGVGYFKVNVNLPTNITSTRAAWEEDSRLEDGLASEYAVDNVLLVLFGGEDETHAEVIQVEQLTDYQEDGVAGTVNQVTDSVTSVVALTAAAQDAENLYALAVINGSGIIEKNDGSSIKALKNDGSALEVKTNCKIADLQAALSANSEFVQTVSGAKHIFMTNAVLSDVRGGKADPEAYPGSDATKTPLHILAKVNPSYIFDTKKKAAGTKIPAVDIYVERGVGKVTLSSDLSGTALTTISLNGPELKAGGTLTATLTGWGLGNTNPTSYVVRQVPAVSNVDNKWFKWNYLNSVATGDVYRFIGNYPVDDEYGTNTAGYRTYWAKDTNYDADATLSNPDWTADASYTSATGYANPLYCNENTFDVAHQDWKNTTTAVLKVTFSGGTFYTVGVDKRTLYSDTEVTTLIANALMSQSAFITWLNTVKKPGVVKVTASDLIIDWTTAAGLVTINDVTVKTTAINTETALSTVAGGPAMITQLKAQVDNIQLYSGGVAYYAIRIKHFGDDLTPWDKSESATAPAESTLATIYPGTGHDRNDNYLGRYGIVRNNWYDLVIGEIWKVGAATPADLKLDGDHPDDSKEESYIKARINILSWAKRPQSWNLK